MGTGEVTGEVTSSVSPDSSCDSGTVTGRGMMAVRSGGLAMTASTFSTALVKRSCRSPSSSNTR